MSSKRRARRTGVANTATTGPTASQTAFRIAEIRREILLCLSRPDLASFLRVEKGCMEDVVRELYGRTMSAGIAERIESDDSVRQSMYIQAITEIDARMLEVTPSMQQLPGWKSKFDQNRGRLVGYDPVEFNFIVPYFRERYPGLRKIHLGVLPSAFPSWADALHRLWYVVSFDTALDADSPRGPTAYDEGGYRGELGGHIQMCWMRKDFCVDADVTSPIISTFPGPPKGRYTIQHRFNSLFYSDNEDPSPQTCQSWRTALSEGPGFENIYTELRVPQFLPISLDLLTRLYRRQVAAGHVERLQTIVVEGILPWTINEFANLAMAASTLTSLRICVWGHNVSRPGTSFSDLSTLVSLVRTHLPNLIDLAIDLDGVGAEAVCQEQLHEEVLSHPGIVKTLRIAVRIPDGEDEPVLFNAMRVLAGICAPQVRICTCDTPEYDLHVGEKDETEYLQYLLRQPPHCQRHLATVDFAAMGITELREILLLEYHPDGRPFRRKRKLVADYRTVDSWMTEFESASDEMILVEDELDDVQEAFRLLQEIAGEATARERGLRAEQLLELMVPLKARFDQISRSLDVDAVRKYIKKLDL